jgi:hypothetical protein
MGPSSSPNAFRGRISRNAFITTRLLVAESVGSHHLFVTIDQPIRFLEARGKISDEQLSVGSFDWL